MFLALREIRRSTLRFGLLMAAVALLAFLILFQQALQNALLRGFVGGVRNQTAPVLVFDVDGRRFPQGSTITAPLETAVRSVPEVAAAAPIWQGTFPMTTAEGTGPASVLAYADPSLGGPVELVEGRLPGAPGEVVANATDAPGGYGLGARLRVEPTGLELVVVGRAEDVALNVLPTVFTTPATYLELLRTRNPDASMPPPNVLGVRPVDGVAPDLLATLVNAADDGLDALTKQAAGDRNPGVESIKQSFTVVFTLFAVVVPLVTGLFFLILTQQKANSLTLLRAVGAPAKRLVGALLAQVAVVLGVGLAIAAALYGVVSRNQIDDLALRFEPRVLATWIAVLGSLGVVSALASVRRVLAIDPIAATTGVGR